MSFFGMGKKKNVFKKVEPMNVAVQQDYMQPQPIEPIQTPQPTATLNPQSIANIAASVMQNMQEQPMQEFKDSEIKKKIKKTLSDLDIEIKVKQELRTILSSLI